jgi:multiple sugar transport system permease protein
MAAIASVQRQERLYGLAFIGPQVLGFSAFVLLPMVAAFVISFTDWSLLNDAQWVGGANYERLLTRDPTFWTVLRNSLVFSASLVPVNIVIALALALLLKQVTRGVGLFRTAFFLPVVTSVVVWAILWKYLLAPDGGVINQGLRLIGIDGPNWLFDPSTAMPAVVLGQVLKNVGLNMVIFLAALFNVPRDYYEAGAIDGATGAQAFRSITLPMIAPTLFLVTVITIIGSLKVFALVYVLTRGGPANATSVLVYYIWQQAFQLFNFGYAAALAYVLFALVLVLTLVQWRLRTRWVFHEQ